MAKYSFLDWSHYYKLCEMTKESPEKLYAVEKKPVIKYYTFSYKAGTWEEEQRGIVKIEGGF